MKLWKAFLSLKFKLNRVTVIDKRGRLKIKLIKILRWDLSVKYSTSCKTKKNYY